MMVYFSVLPTNHQQKTHLTPLNTILLSVIYMFIYYIYVVIYLGEVYLFARDRMRLYAILYTPVIYPYMWITLRYLIKLYIFCVDNKRTF